MKLQIAELALDDQDACLRFSVFEHHVGERLDVEPGSDLDHPGSHVLAGQPPSHPGPR